jgi:hypothetical protein
VITTVVKTHGRYWVSNPKQLADSILHLEESQPADIYHLSTPALHQEVINIISPIGSFVILDQ